MANTTRWPIVTSPPDVVRYQLALSGPRVRLDIAFRREKLSSLRWIKSQEAPRWKRARLSLLYPDPSKSFYIFWQFFTLKNTWSYFQENYFAGSLCCLFKGSELRIFLRTLRTWSRHSVVISNSYRQVNFYISTE